MDKAFCDETLQILNYPGILQTTFLPIYYCGQFDLGAYLETYNIARHPQEATSVSREM
jgi:hypothetical protein